MLGVGFFLSDFGVRLKNERILCCFFDLGVELILFLFTLYFFFNFPRNNLVTAPNVSKGAELGGTNQIEMCFFYFYLYSIKLSDMHGLKL